MSPSPASASSSPLSDVPSSPGCPVTPGRSVLQEDSTTGRGDDVKGAGATMPAATRKAARKSLAEGKVKPSSDAPQPSSDAVEPPAGEPVAESMPATDAPAAPTTEPAAGPIGKTRATPQRRKSTRVRSQASPVGEGTTSKKASASPPAEASTSKAPGTARRAVKVKPLRGKPAEEPATPATDKQSAGPDELPATDEAAKPATGKRSLKIVLGGKKRAQSTPEDRAATPAEDNKASATSSFANSLRELGDDEESDEEGPVPAARKRRAAVGATVEVEDAQAPDDAPTSRSKRKRPPARGKQNAKRSAKKPRGGKGRRDDSSSAEVGSGGDSDEEMSDVGSESDTSAAADLAADAGDGDDDFVDDDESSKKKRPRKPQGPGARKTNAKAGVAETAKSGGSKSQSQGQGARKPSKAEVNKMVAAKIRASAAATSTTPSAAATATASPASSTPLRGPPGASGTRPMGAGGAGKRPVAAKPRGNDMWDSLLGGGGANRGTPSGARPPAKPVAAEEAAQKAKAAEAEKSKAAGGNEGTQPRTQQQGASNSLPRPLGTSGNHHHAGRGASSFASSSSSTASNHRPDVKYRDSTITVTVTPGLNGQHWDKEAYRQLRISEKHANREHDPSALLNLLEDAQTIFGFEEEWKAQRVRDRFNTPALRPHDFGGGLSYAAMYKEAREKSKQQQAKAM